MKSLITAALVLLSLTNYAQVKVDTLPTGYVITSPFSELGLASAWNNFGVFEVRNDTAYLASSKFRVLKYNDSLFIRVTDDLELNHKPIVDAGRDTTVSSQGITLKGTATDKDGTIVKFQWSQVGGPTAYLPSPNSQNATATLWVVGTYIFELSATDDKNSVVADRVTVIRK